MIQDIFSIIVLTILLLLCLNLYLKLGNLSNRLDDNKDELSNIFKEIDRLLSEHEKDVKKLKTEMKQLVIKHEIKEHTKSKNQPAE